MKTNYANTDLSGKVAVVTGGASGMGREIARALVACGAKVTVGDINTNLLNTLKDELGEDCAVCEADVTQEVQVKALIDLAVREFGSLDIGVNCAGAGVPGPLLEIEEETWDKSVNLNLKGFFLSLKHEALQMRKQGRGGVIINITSITGVVAAVGLAPYACAKAATNHLTRIAAQEFGNLGIRVVAIAPGLIRTPLAQEICDTQDLREGYLEHVPCGRVGEVEDIAKAAIFLASDNASYINGTVTYVEGGQYADGGFADLASTLDYYKG